MAPNPADPQRAGPEGRQRARPERAACRTRARPGAQAAAGPPPGANRRPARSARPRHQPRERRAEARSISPRAGSELASLSSAWNMIEVRGTRRPRGRGRPDGGTPLFMSRPELASSARAARPPPRGRLRWLPHSRGVRPLRPSDSSQLMRARAPRASSRGARARSGPGPRRSLDFTDRITFTQPQFAPIALFVRSRRKVDSDCADLLAESEASSIKMGNVFRPIVFKSLLISLARFS